MTYIPKEISVSPTLQAMQTVKLAIYATAYHPRNILELNTIDVQSEVIVAIVKTIPIINVNVLGIINQSSFLFA